MRFITADLFIAEQDLGQSESIVGLFGGQSGRLQRAQFTITVQNIVQRRAFDRRRFLSHVGNFKSRRHRHVADIGLQSPQNQFKKTGFAGAIRTRDTHPVTPVQGKAGLFEQDPATAPQRDGLGVDHAGSRSVPWALRAMRRLRSPFQYAVQPL